MASDLLAAVLPANQMQGLKIFANQTWNFFFWKLVQAKGSTWVWFWIWWNGTPKVWGAMTGIGSLEKVCAFPTFLFGLPDVDFIGRHGQMSVYDFTQKYESLITTLVRPARLTVPTWGMCPHVPAHADRSKCQHVPTPMLPHYDGRALSGNPGLQHLTLHGPVQTPDKIYSRCAPRSLRPTLHRLMRPILPAIAPHMLGRCAPRLIRQHPGPHECTAFSIWDSHSVEVLGFEEIKYHNHLVSYGYLFVYSHYFQIQTHFTQSVS